MKTLAVSLHRLGDLIMHAHVLKAFKEETGESISLLTHVFFKQVAFLFPFIDNVYIFERDFCQRSIGESHFNKTWPYHHISELLENINLQNFDRVIDLSQSETSSRWMTFIESKHKIGVAYNSDKTKKLHCSDNYWIRNLHAIPQSKIHFIDVFKKALGLSLDPLPQVLQQYPEQVGNKKRIVLQTLSSDIKKNWPPVKWVQLIQKILKDFPDFEVIILSSPSELNQLQKNFACLADSVQILSTSMQEAYFLLKTARLLVTLDTAIKHLATWAGIPIVELALGSSNPDETGVYQEGAIILKSQVSCSPCRHSKPCAQSSFICHDNLSVGSVFVAIQLQLHLQLECENKPFVEKSEKFKIINHFLAGVINKSLLTPISYVHSSEDGWWRGQAIQTLEMENHYGRRIKESVEINY